MKKIIGRILIVFSCLAVFALVGNMDYADQQFDTERTEEIRQRILLSYNTDAPSLDRNCLSPDPSLQHCQARLSRAKR